MKVVKELKRELSEANDGKLAQVVAIVDQLHERGKADGLIAPLRPRLAQLRPARPLRLARLLFLPLDPLIVPPTGWRSGALTVPRTAILPFAATLRLALPATLVDAVETLIATHSTADAEVIAKAGRLLWPAAGSLLAEVPPSVGWDATGLPATEYPPLAKAVAGVLAQAVPLHDLRAASQDALPDPLAGERILRAAASGGAEAVARVLALILGSLPNAVALLQVAETRAGLTQAVGRAATDDAIAFFLDSLEDGSPAKRSLAACTLPDAGATVRRIASVLDQLAENARSPERRQRIAEVKRIVDADCRKRFASAIETELLQPIAQTGTILSDAAMIGLEDTARDIRRLEQAGRRIGGAATYDTLLRETTATVSNGRATPALGKIDRVRMVEILSGPEQALALLAGDQHREAG